MNKFLNKNVKASVTTTRRWSAPAERDPEKVQVLQEFAACWYGLAEARRKDERSIMYSKGDQWGDMVPDPDHKGQMIKEADLIRREGKQPLKNNMISPIINNIEGQFRTSSSKNICYVRDPKEAKYGELYSTTLEYAHDMNCGKDIDAKTAKRYLNSGFGAYRVEYGLNPATKQRDVWYSRVQPSRLFFNTNLEDERAWDLTHIGELFDMRLQDVQAHFSDGSKEKADWLANIYGPQIDKGIEYNSEQRDSSQLDFYIAKRTNLCRVIFGWKLETRDSYYWQDELNGTWGFVPYTNASRRMFEYQNAQRISEAAQNGVDPDDILLIQYEYQKENFWHYYYFSPYGDVLQEGDTPYWHQEHNYVLFLQDLTDGVIYNYVEQFIDQQRAINRTASVIDFIRGSSSKGVLVVDEEAFPTMTRDDILDNFVRYNGVLYTTLKNGQRIDDVLKQYNSSAAVAGDYELLNLHLRLINEISGVSGAMQGQAPTAGTAASLYDQQVQNSSLNLRGTLDAIKEFMRKRDYKVIQMQQQFYDRQKFLDIAGGDYADIIMQNPEKVRNIKVDVQIEDGGNTPTYQMQANNFLLELLRMNAIGVRTFLEECSYPFAPKILAAIDRAQAEMEAGQPVTPIDPTLIQALQGLPQGKKLNRVMDDKGGTPSMNATATKTVA